MKEDLRKNTMALVVMNEQHSLLPEQELILEQEYPVQGYKILKVPSEGWSREDMDKVVDDIIAKKYGDFGNGLYLDIVFLSPIPYLIRELTRKEHYSCGNNLFVRIFHNDIREKKVLPSGQVISVVAKEGWQLL